MTHKCVDQKLVYSALRINVLGTLYIVRACTVITAVQKTSNEAFQIHVHNHAFKDPSLFYVEKKCKRILKSQSFSFDDGKVARKVIVFFFSIFVIFQVLQISFFCGQFFFSLLLTCVKKGSFLSFLSLWW